MTLATAITGGAVFRQDDEGRFIVFVAARFNLTNLTEVALAILDASGLEGALRYLMHAWYVQELVR